MGGFSDNRWLKSQLDRGILLLLILLLPAFLGGWRAVTGGETINPNYVQRIKNGQTTKHEILLLFGDPQEIDRSADGLVFTYKSFKDAPAMPYRPEDRTDQSAIRPAHGY